MILWFAIAWACPPTVDRVAEAKALFNDAELEAARQKTQEGLDELGCQTQIVDRGTLLELYRIDAQIALANLDKKGATYAAIRAVVVDPMSIPPPSYGTELAELHQLWTARMAKSTVRLSVSGGGIVYLDGLPLTQGQTRDAVRGEHLVQIDAGTSVVSTVTDLDRDQAVITGLVAPTNPVPMPTVPAPVPLAELDGPVRERKTRRPSKPMMVIGGALAGVGAATLAYAWYRDEVVFPKKPFPDGAAVDREAALIRTLYGTGYVVGGAGVVVLGVGVVGKQVHVEGHWRF